jgi:hypothetical protein
LGASTAPLEHRPLPWGDNFRSPIVLLPGEHFLVPKVVTAKRGAVLLPAGLQAGDESLFDGGADVAVDPALPRQHPSLRPDLALGRTDPGLLVGVNGSAGLGSLRLTWGHDRPDAEPRTHSANVPPGRHD